MAVLEHIHPDSASVFAEIARIAKKRVLAIEPRASDLHTSHRTHGWDVPGEYAKHGLVSGRVRCWSDLWTMPKTRANDWQPTFDRYDAMIFRHANNPSGGRVSKPSVASGIESRINNWRSS